IREWKSHNKATFITLKGSWLDDAGVETGTPLKVRVMPDCLVLTAQEQPPAPPPEAEIMQTLRRVCQFYVRKQKQVTELIEVSDRAQR
ncbi:SymE family type I addiction module toxin, partial [Pantoea eucrina]